MRRLTKILVAAAVLCGPHALSPGHAGAQTLINLYSWYNPERGDHFTTSNPQWAGAPGASRGGYHLLRVEGRVFDPNQPQPPGTVPLYGFWNPGRRDNFLTADPNWTRHSERDGYRRVRLEGYIFTTPVANTEPLISFWDPARTDNYATADPLFRIAAGQPALSPVTLGYRAPSGATPVALQIARRMTGYRAYRVEGYIVPALDAENATSLSSGVQLREVGYAHRSPRAPGSSGVVASAPGTGSGARPQVRTPLIVMMHEFADTVRFRPQDIGRIHRMFSRTHTPSLQSYVELASGGQLGYAPIRIVGPIRESMPHSQFGTDVAALAALQNGTTAAFRRANGFGIEIFDIDGDGVASAEELHSRTRMLIMLGQRGVDFSQYDRNRDGRVDATELQVVRFGADRGIGGQHGVSRSVRLNGVDVETSVVLVARDTPMQGVSHELMHVWGLIDIYGPGFALNTRTSMAGAMIRDDRFLLPDPWHAIQFGWARPRFATVGSGNAAGPVSVRLGTRGRSAPVADDARPVVLYDPVRGFGEFFVVEYRSPLPRCRGSSLPELACPDNADNAVAMQGVAIWHVVIGDRVRFDPVLIERPASNPRFWQPRGADGGAFWMAAVYPPDGLLGGSDSGEPFWRESDGPIRLRWRDGTSVGVTLRVGPMTPTASNVYLEWSNGDAPFRPRIDGIRQPAGSAMQARVAAGQAITLTGVYGSSSADRVLGLVSASGARQRLEVRSWNDDVVVATVPSAAAAGDYTVVAGDAVLFQQGRLDALSNPVRVSVLRR